MVLRKEVTGRIKEVLGKHPEGLSITDLVRSVDINRNTAGRYLENLLLSGQVEMRRLGMAKMYTLANRLPVSSVLSISSELVMQLDSGQRITYANDTLLTFLGASAKDLFGKNIEFTKYPVVFEDVFPDFLDHVRRGLKGEEWHGELPCPVQGRFFFCRVAPTVSNEGTKGVSVLLEDITDQKRDEVRIRESEARLRSIFKVSPVGIGTAANRIFLEVNDRFCQITGYSPAELVGKSARILYPSDAVFEEIGSTYMRQIRENGSGAVETQWVKKDGTAIDILLSSTPLDPANISGGITFTALDISERNKAERALRESESTARALLNAPTDTIILLDSRGVILDLNETAVRRLGRKREDVVGVLSDTVLPPDLAQKRRRNVSEVLTTRKPVRFTDENRGTWFDNVAYPILDTQGNVARLAIIARDITDQVRVEAALRENETKYRTLSEASRDLIFVIDRNDRVEYVNSCAAATLGLPADRVIGQKRSALFTGDMGERQAQELRRVFETGKAGRSEGPMKFLGSPHWFDHFLTPIKDANGMITSVLGVSRDITDRKHTEQALRESEEKYRYLVEQSQQGLTIIQNGRPVFANAAMLEINGYSREEYLAFSAEEMLAAVHPDDRDRIRAVMAGRLEGKNIPAENEYRILRKDGGIRWVLTHGALLSFNGAPAIQATYFDITDRNLAEQALRESEDRNRKLVEILPDAVFLHQNGSIIYVNPAAVRILGASDEHDLLGKNVLDFVQPEYRDAVRTNITRDLHGEFTPSMELQMSRIDGSPIVVEGRGIATIIDGKPSVLVAINDITGRNRAGLSGE
jgi:PAS domain S-box-containing protein